MAKIKTKVISVRIPLEIWNIYKEGAEKELCSVSWLIKCALKRDTQRDLNEKKLNGGNDGK